MLHLACASGSFQVVDYLISQCGCDTELRTHASGQLPIHNAALGGHTEIVRFFCEEKKCDPTLEDNLHEDCLTLATKKKHSDLAEYLIGLRAFNLNKKNERSGFTYFSYAVVKGAISTARAILEQMRKAPESAHMSSSAFINKVINPVIFHYEDQDYTLIDLCLQKKFRIGVQFLVKEC